MALVHETLHGSDTLGAVDFGSYAGRLSRELVSALTVGKAVQLRTEFDPFRMSIDVAVPCGLILNELISNAFKHAFPNDRAGRIWIELAQRQDGTVMLSVSDDGCGIPPDMDPNALPSLGSQMIFLLAQQLDGEVAITRSQPTRVTVSFAGKQ